MMNKLGLYIHIPFCKRKCGYCDFYSLCDLSLLGRYVDRLCEDLQSKSKICAGYTVDTIYFGGGTPSLLSADDFSRIMQTLHQYYRVSDDCEITVEVNPSSADPEKAACYRACGVNRISIGMQSASDDELSNLGRLHDRTQFEQAYRIFRDAGFDNISVDLMYALPGQTPEHTIKSAEYLIDLAPEHISAYCLKIEPGTPFAERALPTVSDDTAFACYEQLCDLLQSNGYMRYEMSNFAKNGRISRHNMKYWTGQPYLGFGPASYSYFEHKRYGRARDLQAYLNGEDILVDCETVDPQEAVREHIMLGLRLAQGVESSLPDRAKVKALAKAGYLTDDGSRICLTTKGFFVSNSIISEFLD